MRQFIVIAMILLCGCASAINEYNAHRYAIAGAAAQKSGDWDMARKLWAKAAINAELGGMTDQQKAVAFYEYGRSCGVTCFFEESEKYLLKSLESDKTSSGPIHMSLLELARLNFDQAKYEAANLYFEQLPSLYEKFNASEKDPAGVAMVYEEFSKSLEFVNRRNEALKYRNLSERIKKTINGRISSTERTPYGRHCK